MRYIYIIDASKVVMIKEPTPQDYKYFNSLEDNDLDHDGDDVDDHVHTVDDVRRHGHHVVAPPLPSYHQPFSRSIDDHDDIDMMNAMTINNNVHPNQLFNQPLYTPASFAVVGTPSTTTSAAAAAVAVHSTNSSVDHHHRSSSSGSSSSSSSSNSNSSRRQEVISTSSIAPSSIAISMAPPPVIVMSQQKVDVPVSTAFTVGLIDEGKVVKPMPIALRRKMIADQQHQQQLGEVLDDVDDYDDDDDS
jgi:hypothetical protein